MNSTWTLGNTKSLQVECFYFSKETGGGGNWEFQYYTNNRSNSYVKDGKLFIKPTLTEETIGKENVIDGYNMELWGSSPADQCTGNQWYGCQRMSASRRGGNVFNPVQSARLRSVNSFSFKYGTIEVRAKLPRGDWIWPAIWLLPVHNNYGQWPASGEIDLVESRGNVNFGNIGVQQMGSTLHWGPFFSENGYPKTHKVYNLPQGDFADKFRVFKLHWSAERMITYVDDMMVLNVTIDESFWKRGGWDKSSFNNPWDNRPNNKFGVPNAPFDQKYYIIMNVAIGGTADYWPDGISPSKPWNVIIFTF
jgi:beta-glucanase (GH16 family)